MRGSERHAGSTTSKWCLGLARLSGPCLLRSKTLSSPKKQANVVYKILCTCGKVYIRQTKRRHGTRLKEHKDACFKCKTDKSAIAEHAWSEDHSINWSGTKILQRTSHTMERVMKKAPCIQSTPADSHFNRDSEYELPDCWFTLNRKLRGWVIVARRSPGTCAAWRNYPPNINSHALMYTAKSVLGRVRNNIHKVLLLCCA